MGCDSCKKKNIINDKSIKGFEKSYNIGLVIGIVMVGLSIYGLYSLIVKIL
jgi:hypothetical protein